ncbi:Protein of unknown function [Lentibacillus halodurans]|uniref:Lysozyme inhibitor LprI-like N-terminal domain-containing protein n=1 Tax=Lentibacillus halodurans TaxID=237679 RepID=A0A1I0ZH06_9BACI|nr:lysozyme inhibitor LprI family protein [Lentibacillus halodurans]SFB24687.1 Protein of unknown function [Lentibacillus halodurans]
MKNNHKFLMVMLTVIFVVLVACGNASEESNANSSNKSLDRSTTQNANGNLSNKSSKDTDKNRTENSSEDTDDTHIHDQEDTSENTSANSNDGKSLTSGNSDDDVTENKKEEYLNKLNRMEESDKNAEAKTTISDMEEQEEERYKNWDKALNEIYGVLKEQLSTEQMDKLRKEQRNWVEHRDEAAKKASLEYEGGSTESLEYVATQASLTKERCYKLVANYMK